VPFSRIGVKLKPRDNGDLVSPGPHHDMVVRPKERAAAILAQVDREMARIKERDHHWEDGIEVSRLTRYHPPFCSPPRRMRINPSLSPKPSATSSGFLHPRHPDHRHRGPDKTRRPPFRSGVPYGYVVAVEVCCV
jgi:hypothetical protein